MTSLSSVGYAEGENLASVLVGVDVGCVEDCLVPLASQVGARVFSLGEGASLGDHGENALGCVVLPDNFTLDDI